MCCIDYITAKWSDGRIFFRNRFLFETILNKILIKTQLSCHLSCAVEIYYAIFTKLKSHFIINANYLRAAFARNFSPRPTNGTEQGDGGWKTHFHIKWVLLWGNDGLARVDDRPSPSFSHPRRGFWTQRLRKIKAVRCERFWGLGMLGNEEPIKWNNVKSGTSTPYSAWKLDSDTLSKDIFLQNDPTLPSNYYGYQILFVLCQQMYRRVNKILTRIRERFDVK